MPAPREGDETVSIKQQRVTRACEADEVERAEEWDREREVGLQPAEPGNGGQQDDGQREEAHRAVPAPEPVDRDQHAERDKRDRDRACMNLTRSLMKSPQAAPSALSKGTSLTNRSTTSGSHWRPAPAVRIASASSTGLRCRYGRSLTSASNASQTEAIRASRGIPAPDSRSGSPLP